MANAARKPVIKADIQVIDELPAAEQAKGVLVRAKASRDHENDARPIGGFFVRRRYAGDEFVITKPEQFSPNWMEFVDEPPQEWLDAMKVNEERKAELMAKQKAEAPNPADALMFALSQVMARSQGLPPSAFNYSTGQLQPTQPATTPTQETK